MALFLTSGRGGGSASAGGATRATLSGARWSPPRAEAPAGAAMPPTRWSGPSICVGGSSFSTARTAAGDHPGTSRGEQVISCSSFPSEGGTRRRLTCQCCYTGPFPP